MGPRMNHRIRVPEVRVIDAEGAQLGVMATRDALSLAREQGLDLVEVAPMAHPPVCRILDYGKHKYDEAKKQRQARKNAHATEIKGIRIKPGTETHDLEFKLKDTIRFLQEGHKVQVTLIFRGRETAHPEIGRAQMDRLAQGASAAGVVERPPVLEGRRMTMLLAPK
jgi:translation initiation factor IF-3